MTPLEIEYMTRFDKIEKKIDNLQQTVQSLLNIFLKYDEQYQSSFFEDKKEE